MSQNKQTEFLIHIKSQENQSWQGTIQWLKENRKEYFRSAIEMIRLIDSVLPEQTEFVNETVEKKRRIYNEEKYE